MVWNQISDTWVIGLGKGLYAVAKPTHRGLSKNHFEPLASRYYARMSVILEELRICCNVHQPGFSLLQQPCFQSESKNGSLPPLYKT